MRDEIIKTNFDLREKVYKKTLRETAEQPKVVRMAKCLAEFLAAKSICVDPDDLLAGNAQYCNYACSSPAGFREEISKYEEKTGIADPNMDLFEAGLNAKLYQRGQAGHVIAGYDMVLEAGVGALIENARQCEAFYSDAAAARSLAVASGIVCAALSDYIGRYAAEARSQGMDIIADACKHVARRPPESFCQAVQLLWLAHEVVTLEQGCGSMSLGRLDKYLYPFYENDCKKGILNRETARDIIEALFKKLGGLKRGFQNVTLGGADADGNYTDNDITRICLEVSASLMIDQPLLSMRCAPGMSDGLWDAIFGLMETGIGFPALFNDKIAVQSKLNAGIPPEDVYNYGIVGCVEVSIPGKEYAHTEGLRINWAKTLELMFNGGVCKFTGYDFGLAKCADFESIRSFNDFYDWYKAEFLRLLTIALDVTNALDESYGENWPTPYMSSLMRGCVRRGRDVNAGGAAYNLTTVNGCGMANAVDSLCAIEKLVFDEKLCTFTQLKDAMDADFEGAEHIRQAALNSPKYGNGDDRADRLMAELTGLFTSTVTVYRNPRGGVFQCGLYTVDHHAHMGRLTGALPDGRKSGVSLANGFSPAQGADKSGPTAVIVSTVKNDLAQLGNGMVLDLKFSPSVFRKNKPQIRSLIETYMDMGGYEIQFNVVDRDTLLEAQKNPDQYRNLIVRVSGFSAYFADLGVLIQNEIIARTEHM